MIRRYFSRLSYRWKIMSSYIVIILIPITVLGSYVYVMSIQSIERQAQLLFHEDIQRKKSEIESRMNEYEDIAQKISINPILVRYFENTTRSDIENVEVQYQYIIPFLDWVGKLDPNGLRFRVFTENESIFENEVFYYAEELKQETWYGTAARASYSKPVWEPFHPERRFKYSAKRDKEIKRFEASLFIPMVSNLYYSRKSLLELYFEPEDIFGSFNVHTMTGGYMLVKDSKGEIVYSSGNDQNEAAFLSMADRIPSISRDTVNIDKSAYFVSVAEIPRLQCTVVTFYPMGSTAGKVQRAKLIYIGTIFVGLSLLLIFSLLLSNTLVKKIRNMIRVIRCVQKGDLDIRIPVNGSDEIDEIAQDFNEMLNRINRLIDQVYKYEIFQKDALYKALQNQINPHFMFNAIETIRMMAEIRKQRELADALEFYGNVIRYNISQDKEMVPIRIELEQVESYYRLQRLMMNGRLHLELFVEETLEEKCIPKLTIQPLVENAVLHAFKIPREEFRIQIDIVQEDGSVIVRVRDNGCGMSEDQVVSLNQWLEGDSEVPEFPVKGHGVGMRNVQQRLRLRFGSAYGLRVYSSRDAGTLVEMKVPALHKSL